MPGAHHSQRLGWRVIILECEVLFALLSSDGLLSRADDIKAKFQDGLAV